MSQDSSQAERPKDRASGCLVRIFWMMLGYLILIFAAISIAKTPSATRLSIADLVWWATVAGIIAARYWDITAFGGKRADGQSPATMADWKRFSVLVFIATAIVWALLHVLAAYRGA